VLAASASTQQAGALYPGVALPGAVELGQAPQGGGPGLSGGDPVLLGGPAFDFRHLTPSPNPAVRDLDGDGHLDGAQLDGGVTVWRNLGDGRFATGTYLPTTVPWPLYAISGQWGDMNGDGRLDALFMAQWEAEVLLDQGDGTFAPDPAGPQPTPVRMFSNDAHLADLDGDGLLDAMGRATNPFESFRVMYGAGGALFTSEQALPPPPEVIQSVATADMNGDGQLDVVGTSGFGLVWLQVWLQQPAGTFTIAQTLSGSQWMGQLEARDLSGDGVPDVSVLQDGFPGGDEQRLYRGLGDGTLDPDPVVAFQNSWGARFVDVDLDGRVDVLTNTAHDRRAVEVRFSRSDGSLSPPLTTEHTAVPMGTGDLNGDGRLDVFTGTIPLLGRGDGRFVTPRTSDLGARVLEPQGLVLGDWNGDGLTDALAMEKQATVLKVVLAEGAAAYGTPSSLVPANVVRGGAAGDLDGDGDLDLAVCHAIWPEADLWVGRGDGTFDSGPVITWGGESQASLGMGQFNGDGTLDLVAAGTSQLLARRNDGGLAFGPLKSFAYPAGASLDTQLVTADVNGDGLTDVFALTPGVHLYRCTGHVDFAAPVAVAGDATHLTVTDVDGDGELDVIASEGPWATVALGDGLGGFTSAPTWSVASDDDVWATAVADLDLDGVDDLLLGHGLTYAALGGWDLHRGLPGGGYDPVPLDRFDVPYGVHRFQLGDVDADGFPDVTTFGSGMEDMGISVFLHTGGPWRDAGFALGGVDGPPFLLGTGSLGANTPVGLELRDAPDATPAHLVLGLSGLFAPVKGGVLVPDPLLVESGLVTDGDGQLSLVGTWPPGVPPGAELWLQVWIQDATGPKGVTASRGVVGTAP
jgi:hypothetical protein